MSMSTDGSAWPKGLGEMLWNLQNSVDANEQLLDEITRLVSMPPVFYDASSGWDPAVIPLAPGVAIPVSNAAGIKQLEVRVNIAPLMERTQSMLGYVQRLSRVTDPNMGLGSPNVQTAAAVGGATTTDHGLLSGLADLDHAQYLSWGLSIGGRGGYVREWAYDGVDGTARTVIANGTGDVAYVLSGTFVIRDSAGNVTGGAITATAPGANFTLYDDGGTNTCLLQAVADGSVTVQRTAGARTFKVALRLLWL
jgi:hypothetical protein